VMTTVDPKSCAQPTGCQAVQSVTPLVRTEGYEAGLRSQVTSSLTTSASLWVLKQKSELLFTGDAGTTEASRPSIRRGLEVEAHYQPIDWLTLDFAYDATHARFDDGDPQGIGTRIPGALETVATLALTVHDYAGWFGSVDLRYFGPRPLIEDDSVRSQSAFTTALRVGKHIGKRYTATLDVFNLFNRKVSDVDYYYLSRISGFVPATNDIHFHPIDPFGVRLTLSAAF